MSGSETTPQTAATDWPKIRTVGVDGILVSFGDRLSEPANRAALAFRAALDRAAPEGVEETSTSLVSAYVRFDPVHRDHAGLRADLDALLQDRDWYDADLPQGRREWCIPTVFGTDSAPQLDEAAAAAGMTADEAIASISESVVRVQTIGFAPGQPYLGELAPEWDIPRQKALNERIPEGALAVAIRQLVLFSVSTPTGWRHIGQTKFRLFRPGAETPFVLRPGDAVRFEPVSRERLEAMKDDPDGGARAKELK